MPPEARSCATAASLSHVGLLLFLLLPPAWAMSHGGGSTAAGLQGAYFNNTGLSGPPTYIRRDVRIDFDWGSVIAPGGSTSKGFKELGTDGYSIRWTGQVIPQFSQTYTFIATADAIRLWVDGQLIIDHWPASEQVPSTVSGNIALNSGTAVDIKVEYRELSGIAQCQLAWSCPAIGGSEIIEPVSASGLMVNDNELFADAMHQTARYKQLHADGTTSAIVRGPEHWPTTDFVLELNRYSLPAGTHALRFSGQAELKLAKDHLSFEVDGTDYGQHLPRSVGYDAASNTTTVRLLRHEDGYDGPLSFENTQRDVDGASNTGVTDIQLMVPTVPGGDKPYDFDVFTTNQGRAAYDVAKHLRWLKINNDAEEEVWADRDLPFDGLPNRNFQGNCYEENILICNETGKDMWITLPHLVDDAYLTKVAQLLRYGSDGVEPYTGPTADPVYPPLNPNLAVYVEYTNEAPWNIRHDFPQSGWMHDEVERLFQAWRSAPNSADGQRFAMLNYDGIADGVDTLNGNGGIHRDIAERFYGLRIKEISDIFRAVWGDENMMTRVRPFMNYFVTTRTAEEDKLRFLNDYFNNGDGVLHVADPHPVNYFIYGAGGGGYYGSSNPHGFMDESFQELVTIDNADLEDVSVGSQGYAKAPSNASWSFSGNAGIARNQSTHQATTTVQAGTLTATLPTAGNFCGYRFTVGEDDLAVYQLGRMKHAGNSEDHQVLILEEIDNDGVISYEKVVASAVPVSSATDGNMAWAEVTGRTLWERAEFPVCEVLRAGRSYLLVAEENGADQFRRDSSLEAAQAGELFIDQAVVVSYDSENRIYRASHGGSSTVYGSVGMLVSSDNYDGAASWQKYDTPPTYTGIGHFPITRDGEQFMYIGEGGSASIDITFHEPGAYALGFYSCSRISEQSSAGIRFELDGRSITSKDRKSYEVNETGTQGTGRGFGSNKHIWMRDGSAPFEIASAGTYTLTISMGQGWQRWESVLGLDALEVTSVEAIFGPDSGYMPGRGEALGQAGLGGVQELMEFITWGAQMPKTYGLKAMAYETGWSMGGDFLGEPIQYWAKYLDPRAEGVQLRANNHQLYAGFDEMNWGVYKPYEKSWEKFSTASDYPIWKGIRASNDQLRLLPNDLSSVVDSGERIMDTYQIDQVLTPADSTHEFGFDEVAGGSYVSWNVVVAEPGLYRIGAATRSGGEIELQVDASTVLAGGASGQLMKDFAGEVFLQRGLHAVRVQLKSGSFADAAALVESVEIITGGTSFAPTGVDLVYHGDGSITIRWVDSSNDETGYRIERSTSADFSSDLVTFTVGPDVTSYHDTSVQPGINYFYRVFALNGEKASEASPTVATGANILAQTELDGVEHDDADYVDIEVLDEGVERVRFDNGPGLNDNIPGWSRQAISWTGWNSPSHADSLAAAVANEQYISMTVTPASGSALDITGLDLNLGLQHQSAGASFDLRSELTGNINLATWSASDGKYVTGSVDLSAHSALRDLSDPVVFRIYSYSDPGTVTGGLRGIVDRSGSKDVILRGIARGTQAPPMAPTDLSAAATDTSIALHWIDRASDEQRYVIEISADGRQWNRYRDDLPADTDQATVGDLLPLTSYHLRVYASNAAGDSNRSNTVVVTTGIDIRTIDIHLERGGAPWPDIFVEVEGQTVGPTGPDGSLRIRGLNHSASQRIGFLAVPGGAG